MTDTPNYRVRIVIYDPQDNPDVTTELATAWTDAPLYSDSFAADNIAEQGRGTYRQHIRNLASEQ